MFSLYSIFAQYPKYRLKQAQLAIFQQLISNWQEATNFPLTLREELNEKFLLNILATETQTTDENTQKILINLIDGYKIEAVLMRHRDGRNTVCVSSQAGCPLACTFCATGKMGFKRNLNEWEILIQILYFARLLKQEEEKITNVVFMGMGEPLLNIDNVLSTIKILNDPNCFNLGARKISVSTSGIIEGIKKLSLFNLQINLALSLHAPNDLLRSKLMPINNRYSLKKVMPIIDDYIKKTNRRVMFEYIMLRDVNDSPALAEQLAKLLKDKLCFVNLIPFNSSPELTYQPSKTITINKFKKILEKNGIVTVQRYRFGTEIKGACGQLATTFK